jgi:hypothetical protein
MRIKIKKINGRNKEEGIRERNNGRVPILFNEEICLFNIFY